VNIAIICVSVYLTIGIALAIGAVVIDKKVTRRNALVVSVIMPFLWPIIIFGAFVDDVNDPYGWWAGLLHKEKK